MEQIEQLKKIFLDSNSLFLAQDKECILQDNSEMNLCGSLKSCLEKYISMSEYKGYKVDNEYNRNYGNVKEYKDKENKLRKFRPDIIVHTRGRNILKDNLICIEMKKSSATNEQKEKDKLRLCALTKQENMTQNIRPRYVSNYKLGIYYEINIAKRIVSCIYYINGSENSTQQFIIQ